MNICGAEFQEYCFIISEHCTTYKGPGKRGHIVADTNVSPFPARATFVADTNIVPGTRNMFLILFRDNLCSH